VEFDEARANRAPVESRTIAHVHGFQIPFEVYEGEVEVEVPPEELPPPKKNAPPGPDRPHPTKIIPSGKLAIYIHDEHHYGIRRRWADRKTVLVESQIPTFVEGVMLLAEHRKQQEEAWAKRRAQWDEEARIRGLAEERKRVQAILIYDLKDRAEDVKTGKEILAFLTEMQDHLRQKGEAVNLGSELDAWVHWAYLHGEALIENAFGNFSPLRVPPQEKRFPGYG